MHLIITLSKLFASRLSTKVIAKVIMVLRFPNDGSIIPLLLTFLLQLELAAVTVLSKKYKKLLYSFYAVH